MSIQNKNMIYGGLCLLMLFFASTDVCADKTMGTVAEPPFNYPPVICPCQNGEKACPDSMRICPDCG